MAIQSQGLRQVQKQTQSLVLAPQLRQSLKILQVPALELRSAILEELQTNPLLEEMSGNDESLDAEEIGIPFAPVATTEDLYDDPQLNAEGRMCETILPNGKSVKLPRIPVEVGDHQFELRRQPPEIGEHTREVLSELGYDENDVTTLEESGAVKSR